MFLWTGFAALIVFFLLLDLGLFNKKKHVVSIKEAIVSAIIWFCLALVFNVIVFYLGGTEAGLQFFTGYLIEKSLSFDNLFVMLLVFTSFRINAELQHKALFFGIGGAIVLRGILIALGSSLIQMFNFLFYFFGALLILGGIKLFFETKKEVDNENHIVVRIAKKFFPISKRTESEKFFIKENERWHITVLFISILVIEISDVVFALDSIPAIFSITTDPFIIWSSNVFAILGLRSLYFVIARMHDLFAHLKYGLGIILCFVGLKMILAKVIPLSTLVSLAVVFAILITTVITSVIFHKQEPPEYIHE